MYTQTYCYGKIGNPDYAIKRLNQRIIPSAYSSGWFWQPLVFLAQ
jgi:hypothetical protein